MRRAAAKLLFVVVVIELELELIQFVVVVIAGRVMPPWLLVLMTGKKK